METKRIEKIEANILEIQSQLRLNTEQKKLHLLIGVIVLCMMHLLALCEIVLCGCIVYCVVFVGTIAIKKIAVFVKNLAITVGTHFFPIAESVVIVTNLAITIGVCPMLIAFFPNKLQVDWIPILIMYGAIYLLGVIPYLLHTLQLCWFMKKELVAVDRN